MPNVHQPSYMERFYARDDDRDPLFLAHLLALLGTTLIQVDPRFAPCPC